MRGLRFLPRPIRTYYRAKKRRVEFNICFSEQAARGNGKHGFGKRISNWLKLLQRVNDEQATEYTGQSDAEHIRNIAMQKSSAEQKLVLLERFCMGFDRGRGIWKQIDENRELLQFLFKEFPEIKERAPFVESWIEDTDFFLNCLVELLELKQTQPSPFFPRYWPGQLEDPKKNASTIIQKLEKPSS